MKTAAFILLAVVLVSCGSVKPEAPEIHVAETIEIPEQPVSVVKVPVKINLKPYFDETNKSVPKDFSGGDHPCSGVSYSYYFKRDPIKFKGTGKHLQFDVKGSYWMRASYCVECVHIFSAQGECISPILSFSCGVGEPMRKMYVSYKTKIGVSPDYHLTAKTTLKELKALSPCKVTAFQFDATSTIEEEVSKALRSVEKDIDKEISSIDLRPEMELTWKAIEEPIDLEGYGYMFLNPKAVGMSDIRYVGDTAFLDAYLRAYPEIRLDTVGFRATELPPLTKFDVSDGFDVKMDITAKYDSLSNILTRDFAGMKTDIKGKEVIFGDVEVYGAADQQLSIKLAFSGKKSGILYLTGTPKFDSEKQMISFPDLEFDIKTRSALLKSAKWLFDKKITDLIRESATIELTEYLESFKGTVDTSLNGEVDTGVYMNGKVDKIFIDYIHPREDALFMRVSSKGSLGIQM